ncbi:MAG: cysteine--tRNA ligase [Fidelibacterota bacterium]
MTPGKVKMYTCGPTVYNFAHIGNLRAYMFEDLLRRFFSFEGYEVTQVMNITDIDDKTIRRSMESGETLQAFTSRYTDAFYEDVDTLNINRAHHYPKATEFIDHMISIIQKLMDKGHAYRTMDGSVFFKVSNFPEYGKLANLNPDQMRVGNRVENDEYEKEEARDFALWKGKKEGEGDIHWDSPWGRGRPGWHIECSVMGMHFLGNHFDIHCGGVDNIFPHHENEIAQSQAATGEPFVNYWLHNEHLLVDGEKMSKSANNFYTLPDLLEKGFSPESIRYTLLSTHYRQKLNFTFDKVKASQKAINRLRELKRRLENVKPSQGETTSIHTEELLRNFRETLSDDLNISGALGVLFTWVTSVFTALDDNRVSVESAKNAKEALFKIDSVLGIIEQKTAEDTSAIDDLIQQRTQARKDKNWAMADEIRNKLQEMNIIIEDTPDGTIWKKI